jgi:hypothetical protein
VLPSTISVNAIVYISCLSKDGSDDVLQAEKHKNIGRIMNKNIIFTNPKALT